MIDFVPDQDVKNKRVLFVISFVLPDWLCTSDIAIFNIYTGYPKNQHDMPIYHQRNAKYQSLLTQRRGCTIII